MVDPERIERRLREIDTRLGSLKLIEGRGPEAFRSDATLRTQAERHLQIAIQAAIDIAVHVLAEDSGHSPEDYGSAFMELVALGAIEQDLATELRLAAGLRNILVHAYLDVDPAALWDHVRATATLERFAQAIESYLSR